MKIITTPYEVSVFRKGCTIKTKGTVECCESPVRLTVEGLSLNADPSSVRIMLGKGLHGSNVQVKFRTPEEQADLLQEIDHSIASLTSKINACDLQEQIWKENIQFSGSDHFDLNMIRAYTEALPAELEQIFQTKTALEAEKTALLKQRNEQEQQYSRPYAEVDIICDEPGSYPLAMEFYDSNASWSPEYEIRAEEEDQPLTIRLRAAVRQNTGIDWENVNLSLYTGNPSVSAQIPTLSPVHVKFEEERMRTESRAMGKMMMAGMMAMADTPQEAASAMELAEVSEQTAEMEEKETMNEYRLPSPVSIRSGASDEHADLNVQEVPCSYHVITVPDRSDRAFLAAEIKTDNLQDIIGASASLYLKGTYTGDIVIDPDLTRETYDLSLGQDETIRISRIQKKKYRSSVLLKGQLKTEYAYEIQAVSRKKKACRITILDQIPVSDEKSIVVEADNLSGGVLNSDTGEIRWDLELQPEEQKTLTLAYAIAWPKDKKLREVTVPLSNSSSRRFCKTCGYPLYNLKYCSNCGSPA